MTKSPVRVAVTGAAGQIGYALLFRIASGEMLGKDQPVILQLLEIPDEKAQKALKGVMMELEDCAFPLLAGMEAHADPMTAFKNTDYALLVGSRPRGPGMERAELLSMNGAIFTAQGTSGRLLPGRLLHFNHTENINTKTIFSTCIGKVEKIEVPSRLKPSISPITTNQRSLLKCQATATSRSPSLSFCAAFARRRRALRSWPLPAPASLR